MTDSHPRLSILPAMAVGDPNISNSELRTLAVICMHTNTQNGWCFPSQNKIAVIRGISQQLVSRHIKKFVDLGYMDVIQRYDPETNARITDLKQVKYDYGPPEKLLKGGITTPEVVGATTSEVVDVTTPEVVETPQLTSKGNVVNSAPLSAPQSQPKKRRYKSTQEILNKRKRAERNEEVVYSDSPYDDDYLSRDRPKWTIPKTDLAKQALCACGRKYYKSRSERSHWLKIEKAMVPLTVGVTSTYPTEWVENCIAWAEKKNREYRKERPGRLGVAILFPQLLSLIENNGQKLDFVSKYVVVDADDDFSLEGIGHGMVLNDDDLDFEIEPAKEEDLVWKTS